MAIISASKKFALSDLKFSTLKNTESTLFNNAFETYKGKTYEDVLTLRNNDGSGANFGGKGFTLDGNDNATGGRLQLIEGTNQNDATVFDVRGLDIKLTKVDAAIGTNSFSDDLVIWTAQFAGKDTMTLSNSDDNMRGFGGNDKMYGRGGSDILAGDGGNDKIYGGGSGDTIDGGNGADVLRGGGGSDRISGGKGADALHGEAGTDILKGNGGADTFVFGSGGDKDTVKDFNGNNDMLKFANNLWGGGNKSAADIVDEYATKANGSITFNFGDGDKLVLEGYTKLGTLDDLIV